MTQKPLVAISALLTEALVVQEMESKWLRFIYSCDKCNEGFCYYIAMLS